MSRNPILSLWALVGRIRLNPWIGYIALTWSLVAIPLVRMARSGVSRGDLFDFALVALVAAVFTLAAKRERRREEEVLETLTRRASHDRPKALSVDALDALIAQGTGANALNAVEAAIPNAPKNPSLWCLWARCQMANDQPRLAFLGIDRALSLDPSHVEALYLRAWSKRNYWNFSAASSAAAAGLAVAPSHSGLRFEQRESARMIQQWTRAKTLPKQQRVAAAPAPRPKPRADRVAEVTGTSDRQIAAQVAPPMALGPSTATEKSVNPVESAPAAKEASPLFVENVEPTLDVETAASELYDYEAETSVEDDAEAETSVEVALDQGDREEDLVQEVAPIAFPAGDISLDEFVGAIDEPVNPAGDAETEAEDESPWGDFDLSGLGSESAEASTPEPADDPVPSMAIRTSAEHMASRPMPQAVTTTRPIARTAKSNVAQLHQSVTTFDTAKKSPFANLEKFAAEANAALARAADETLAKVDAVDDRHVA